MLGQEERHVLIPAVRSARREGLDLSGPVSADAAWRQHVLGGCDGLVCLYHDQAMIGLKAVASLGVVNWTAGLPFVRVSPGHGTAFDAAGKGRADASGTVEAALLAIRLCRK
jgi:4-hydroxythreonine-4-phosphate dehydrogenase